MLLLPAIDLMDGQVVRLEKGDPERKTIYSNDPPAFARLWESRGADWLHLVDLDAAFEGTPRNLDAVREITAAVGIPCELGGGLRDEASLEAAFEAGVARAVLGTRAGQDLDFVSAMCARFGGERIAVGVDARDGFVALKGWRETTPLRATEFAKAAEAAGAGTLIFTDISTDGMLQGPNFPALEEMLGILRANLIASGGVSSAEDLRRLAALPGLHGTIIGKALYDEKIEGNLRAIVTGKEV